MAINYRKIPRKIIPSVALVALLGLGAAHLSVDTIEEFEGYVPEAYLDPVDIWTKCFGDTRDVVPGTKYTFEQCEQSLNDHALELAQPVMRCVPTLNTAPDKVKAAAVSMAYNIGSGAFCKSSVAEYFRKGEWERGCRRIAEIYKTAKGKELPGLVRRRNYESEMCLQGLEDAK